MNNRYAREVNLPQTWMDEYELKAYFEIGLSPNRYAIFQDYVYLAGGSSCSFFVEATDASSRPTIA